MEMSEALQLGVFGALLAVAAAQDVAARVVPNWLSVSLAVSGVAVHLSAGGLPAAARVVAVALALGAVLLIPWSMRVLGGGDLKLVVGVAAWLGPQRLGAFVLVTAIAGGILAIPFLHRVHRMQRELVVGVSLAAMNAATEGKGPQRRVPYAVAIAVGALTAVTRG